VQRFLVVGRFATHLSHTPKLEAEVLRTARHQVGSDANARRILWV
jgi:hypothetical protein